MKNIFLNITASVAMLIGIMAAITGTRALMGLFDPGYTTFSLLISYNVIMGLVSIMAGYLIWKNHRLALKVSALITIGHICVLFSLLTMFHNIVAQQSIYAMTFRSVVWVLISSAVCIIIRNQKSTT